MTRAGSWISRIRVKLVDVEFQRDIRSASSIVYELARHEHIYQREHVARALCELEAELLHIERKLGGKRMHQVFPSMLTFALGDYRSAAGVGHTPKLKAG